MSWPRDDAKLDRVRALMADEGVDAIVARAPDNVLYLTGFWGMKGYDVCVFPREGDPTLICLEASEEDAQRTAWTSDVRLFAGYDPADPRPPLLRALDLAKDAVSQCRTIGLELSLGTQASDRMVGEPTTFTAGWFGAFEGAEDATPLARGHVREFLVGALLEHDPRVHGTSPFVGEGGDDRAPGVLDHVPRVCTSPPHRADLVECPRNGRRPPRTG